MNFVLSPSGADPIVVEGYFTSSPEQVFAAWTTPDIVMRWFGPEPNSLVSATIDARPGGKWFFLKSSDGEKTFGYGGEYEDVRPNERLIFSWCFVTVHADGQREESPSSRVDVTFAAHGDGTHVRLVHSGVHEETLRQRVGGGWQACFTGLAGEVGLLERESIIRPERSEDRQDDADHTTR